MFFSDDDFITRIRLQCSTILCNQMKNAIEKINFRVLIVEVQKNLYLLPSAC